MLESYPKEFYIKMLNLVEYLHKEHILNPKKTFYKEEVEQCAGAFTRPICKLLSEKVIFDISYINLMDYGNISYYMEDLTPVIAFCKEKLIELENKEHDSLLDIETKRASIMYSKFAIVLSAISIVLTLLLAIGII